MAIIFPWPRPKRHIQFLRVVSGTANAAALDLNVVIQGGKDLILLVTVGYDADTGSPTSVKAGGQDLKLAKRALSGATNGHDTDIWYLVNPPQGTIIVNIVVSASHDISAAALVYSGVDSKNPIIATAQSATANSTAVSTTIGVYAPGALIVDATTINNTNSVTTADAGQTERYDQAGLDSRDLFGSDKVMFALGDTTMTWTTEEEASTTAAVVLNPAQAIPLRWWGTSLPIGGNTWPGYQAPFGWQ